MKDAKMYYLTNTKEAHIKELTEGGAVEAVRDGFVIRPIGEGKVIRTKVMPMNYTGNGKTSLLFTAMFPDDTAIAVLNVRGGHPCGYIKLPEEMYQQMVESNEEPLEYNCDLFYLPVHGGVTYANYGVPAKEVKGILPEGFWVGWDYNHYGDFHCSGVPELDYFYDERDDKKWSTTEIIREANKARQSMLAGEMV